MKQLRFETGVVMATPGALNTLREANVSADELLGRHMNGDWGDLSADDIGENEFSVSRPLRIFSAYGLPNGERVWVITEADRSATTILLPDEY